MRTVTKFAVYAAAAVATGACGFWVGKGSAPEPVAEQPPDPSALPDLYAPPPLPTAGTVADPVGSMSDTTLIEPSIERGESFFALVSQLDAEGIGTIMDEVLVTDLERLQNDTRRLLQRDSGLAFALFDRWVELDIESAANFVGNTDSRWHTEFRSMTLASIAARDPERAIALLEKLRGLNILGELGTGIDTDGGGLDPFAIVCYGLAQSDPALALNTIAAQIEADTGIWNMTDLFDLLGSRIDEALPAVLALEQGERRSQSLKELFREWAKDDPTSALAAAQALATEQDRDRVMGDVLTYYMAVDPAAAAPHVDALANDDYVDDLARVWVRSDPHAALEWVSTRMDHNLIGRLFEMETDKIDPEDAIELIAEMSPETRQDYLRSIGSRRENHALWQWVRQAPETMAQWIPENLPLQNAWIAGTQLGSIVGSEGIQGVTDMMQNLPEGGLRFGFIQRAAFVAASTEPDTAIAWAMSLSGEERDHALNSAVVGWAQEDPSVAAGFATAMTDLPATTIASIASQWAGQDPASAFAWLAETYSDDQATLDKALLDSRTLIQWGKLDPAAATEAILDLPESLAATQVGHAINNWAHHEPRRVSAFINEQLEPGPVRDAAVVSLIEKISLSDPLGAAEWADSLTDPELRREFGIE